MRLKMMIRPQFKSFDYGEDQHLEVNYYLVLSLTIVKCVLSSNTLLGIHFLSLLYAQPRLNIFNYDQNIFK